MQKILLVEDNEMNRDMLSRRLTKRDYPVSIAVNGAEGPERAPLGLLVRMSRIGGAENGAYSSCSRTKANRVRGLGEGESAARWCAALCA